MINWRLLKSTRYWAWLLRLVPSPLRAAIERRWQESCGHIITITISAQGAVQK
jgi:hypothetical protein